MTAGLVYLDISDFRNLLSVKIEPVPIGFNYIYGSNGSGKTSLLEAIYYLSLGRSFRSSILERVIEKSANKLSIFARLTTQNDQMTSVGLERNVEGEIKIRIDGNDVHSIAELASLMPVQLIDSQCHHLIDAGPVFRRKHIDWGVFYLNNDFLRNWKLFQYTLKQRNAGLRHQISRKELDGWTHELIKSAEQLERSRRLYLVQLIPLLEATIAELISLSDLKISYYPGWDLSKDYYTVLQQTIDRDFQLGYTQLGPHKADLKISIRGIPAKDILSRGQQKLFVCGMILARGTLLQQCADKKPIYLIDDLPSELDKESRAKLVALLSKQEAQIFVTAVECNSQSDVSVNSPLKMFHVEHGNVKEVSPPGMWLNSED
jgi:DNA replication and repair protein RecF